jgi:hypothetical protein
MNWIIPMAGNGSRTKTLGPFKPLIQVRNQPIVFWAIQGTLPHYKHGDTYTFITTQAFERDHSVQKNIESIFSELSSTLGKIPDIQFVFADGTPQGPASSVNLAEKYWLSESPVTIVNSDQWVHFQIPTKLGINDGYLPVYYSDSPRSSYAKIENGLVQTIAEKNRISHFASAGVYGFGSGFSLKKCLEQQFQFGQKTENEFFVGPSMMGLLSLGGIITPTSVFAKFDLGNPEAIRRFELAFSAKP